jgi:ribosome-associated protein
MDYGGVVIHIFDEETRTYYELEKLWLDAPRISIGEE